MAWGSMPASLPAHKRIQRAELWAILQALRHCSTPLTVHTDCANVLLLVLKGKRVCTAAGTKHADVWRLIWHCIEDIGLNEYGVQFAKAKAHQAEESTIQAATPSERFVARLN